MPAGAGGSWIAALRSSLLDSSAQLLDLETTLSLVVQPSLNDSTDGARWVPSLTNPSDRLLLRAKLRLLAERLDQAAQLLRAEQARLVIPPSSGTPPTSSAT